MCFSARRTQQPRGLVENNALLLQLLKSSSSSSSSSSRLRPHCILGKGFRRGKGRSYSRLPGQETMVRVILPRSSLRRRTSAVWVMPHAGVPSTMERMKNDWLQFTSSRPPTMLKPRLPEVLRRRTMSLQQCSGPVGEDARQGGRLQSSRPSSGGRISSTFSTTGDDVFFRLATASLRVTPVRSTPFTFSR
ncbi:hypothetical protein CRUP_034240, partial [Coryphaenoides rupestris]